MKNLCRTLAVLAAVLIGLLVTAAAASAEPAANEEAFYAQINGLRASEGKPPLIRDAQADGVARAWSGEMARTGQLSHNPNLKSQVTNWRTVGENVGVGSNVVMISNAFANSPAHKANIVNAQYTHVGVGVVEAGGQVWVTQVFKQARTSSPAVAAPAVPKVPAPPAAPRPTTPPRPRTPAPPRATAPKPAAAKPVAPTAAAAPVAPPTTAAPVPVVEPVPDQEVAPEAPPQITRRSLRAGSSVPSLRTYILNGIAASLLGTVMYLLRGPLFSRRTFAGI